MKYKCKSLGLLYKLPKKRSSSKAVFAVAFSVSRKDILKGINADKAGVHLFRGFWGTSNNASNIDGFYKIEALKGRPVGRVRSASCLKFLKV